MRTQEEIVERMTQIKKDDIFGFRTEVLVMCLDFEHAKPYLKDGTTKDQWEETVCTDETVRAMAIKYLDFAWGKALDHRGLSAGRSTEKMTEFCWLLGLDETVKKIGEAEHAQYGCPKLKEAALGLGVALPTDLALVRMMDGLYCVEGCEEGCGR